jgi:NADPH:quinone reductase-like Zn-dependent oxidoreductase
MATGNYPGQGEDCELGWECAGTVDALGLSVAGLSVGDVVVAVAPAAFATHVIADARLLRAN